MSQFDVEKVATLVKARNWNALREMTANLSLADIADLLNELDKPCRVLLFRALPRELAADVFAELEKDARDTLLRELTDDETRRLLADMAPDDRTGLLEELPGQVTQRLLNLLSPEDLRESRSLLGYPEESVGRLMTPDYVAVRPDWTIEKAMEHVRQRGKDSETIDTVYVTDSAWHLIGVISLRDMIFADPQDTIANVMTEPAISLSAFDDREEAARVLDKYDFSALPVVDSGGVLVGIITADDVLPIAREEATEDFHKSAAVKPLKTGFLDASTGLLVKSRIGWLLTLVFVDLVSAQVLSRYEDVISKVVALVFFLPLLIGCSGNTGSQSSTLVVRDLALGEIDLEDWWRLMLKEAGISLALGLTVSLVVFGPAAFQGGMPVALVVGISAVLIVMLGGLVGMGAPFLLSKFGFDPATSSSPLITSIADILGVMIYFTVATKLLKL